MQIVIDIDEHDYNRIKEIPDTFDCLMARLYKAVGTGTPLPKGHGRLIEVTPKLERELFTYQRYTGINEAPYEFAISELDNAPTIIEKDSVLNGSLERY